MSKQFQKVVSGLECCMSGQPEGLGCNRVPCPYNDFEDCEGMLHRDALALLKAREPKPVHVTAAINHRKIGECPTCGKLINSGDYPNYCGNCGRAVKWE